MKKLLIAVVLMLSSTAFANRIELNERDSEHLYDVLSKWGVREFDHKHDVIKIDVSRVLCWFERREDLTVTNGDSDTFCKLWDLNDRKELKRSDEAAHWLARLLVKHVGSDCGPSAIENGRCFTGADQIHCRHDWDPKPRNGNHHGRDTICWIYPLRPENN